MLDLLPFFATHKYNTNGIAAIGGFFFPSFLLFTVPGKWGSREVAHLRNVPEICYYNTDSCVINNVLR